VARLQKLGRSSADLATCFTFAVEQALLMILQGRTPAARTASSARSWNFSNIQNANNVPFKVPPRRSARTSSSAGAQGRPPPGNITIFNRSHYEDVTGRAL
jgi:polyphosphate kinase 2 (PPK2 family)